MYIKVEFTTCHYCVLRVVGREGKKLQVKRFQAIMLHEREIGGGGKFPVEFLHN